jgi:hypothetical protein
MRSKCVGITSGEDSIHARATGRGLPWHRDRFHGIVGDHGGNGEPREASIQSRGVCNGRPCCNSHSMMVFWRT